MEESWQHPPRSVQPFWDHAHQFAHTKLSALRQQILSPAQGGDQGEVLVGEGLAAEHLLYVAGQKTPDLFIVAIRRRTEMRRLLLGSMTGKGVRAVSCPVLVVPQHQ
jgi:nucleotide-binding universal stress UspA family protein